MFERVLVPLDGSDRAELILPCIAPLVGDGTRVIALRALWIDSAGPAGRALKHVEAQTQQYFDELAERCDFPLQFETRVGPPQEAILEAARDREVDVIAMSTHGRRGMSRWLLGSVTERVMRVAPVPLLLVRSYHAPDEQGRSRPVAHGPLQLKRVLVPIESDPEHAPIAPLVSRIAERFGADIELLRVVVPPLTQGAVQEAMEHLNEGIESFRESGRHAFDSLRHGDPATVILDHARKHGADLIAMQTHGRRGVNRWTIGSVTESVLRQSSLPVLVVPTCVERCQCAAAPVDVCQGE